MSRRDRAPERRIQPDPVYKDVIVARVINGLMMSGKKHLAEKIFYDALAIVEDRTKRKGLDVFKEALENIKPVVEVKSRRIGGATYQVPIEVRPARVITLAIKWLVKYARGRAGSRKHYAMETKLASEIMDAANSEGKSVGKKEETHKIAEANRAFAHYNW